MFAIARTPDRRSLERPLATVAMLAFVFGSAVAFAEEPTLEVNEEEEAVQALRNIPTEQHWSIPVVSRELLLLGPRELLSLGRVWKVNLNIKQATDGDLVHLARLPALRELTLYNGKYTEEGLVHLANLNRLEKLNLTLRDGTGE